jgi:predicted nucleic acid-binding protein
MKYCLDTNVLIQAWTWYYAPDICADYWQCLEAIIERGDIFIAEEVFREIEKEDDSLCLWVRKNKDIFVHLINENVEICLNKVYENPIHHRLADTVKGRSLADPWVIAHAMAEGAIVVTKENKELQSRKKVKIPDVCDNLNIEWINDFEFIRRMGIKFNAGM